MSVEPVDITETNGIMNPDTHNAQLLQMYQQLQAQAQSQSQARSQVHIPIPTSTPTPPALPYVQPSRSPTNQNTIVVAPPQPGGASPATSVRSNASLQLGQLQTDPNGNQGMNI